MDKEKLYHSIWIPNEWWTSGTIFKDNLVCQYTKAGASHGIFFGHSPLDYPTSLFLCQIILIFIFNRTIYYVLQPFRQSIIVAQIIAGIILGQSFLCSDRKISNRLFPPPGKYILKTLSSFGFMLHLFVLGVKIDMSIIRSGGARSIIIGFCGLIFSAVFGILAFLMVRQFIELDQTEFSGIRILIFFNSLTFFMVTNSYIHELKLSNSDMGRLACCSSLVIDAFGMLATVIIILWFDPSTDETVQPPLFFSLLCTAIYYVVLFCILRPMILSIVRRTPEGMTMTESHLLMVLVILFIAWILGDLVGQRFATFFFGLSLPDGPPLGSALTHKLEIFTSEILLPVFCTMTGWRANLYSLKNNSSVWAVELIFMIGQTGKFVGSMISSVLLGVSFENAVPLSLMMSFKGIMEIATFGTWQDNGVLDDRLFTLSMMNIVLFTGVAFPLIRYMYDPSTKYETVKKKTVMGTGEFNDLQILVCIHQEEIVPCIINLLEVSKFNRLGGSISVFALQLIQLTGSSMPILEPIHKYNKSNANFNFDRTINAFRWFEQQSDGFAKIQHFISASPYKSMHDDICALAHDKRMNIVIVPYHKEWGVDGKVENQSPSIREVNKRVLRKAPCSVAILIDKGGAAGGLYCCPQSGPMTYQIAMLYIGGSDDYEALALARRMAEHPSVRLTVIWLKSNDYQPQLHHAQEDLRVMRDFHIKSNKHERINVKEVVVVDGIGTTKAVMSLQQVDMFIVGRYHEQDCPAIQGLMDWSETSEIGSVGEMLVTSDFKYTILVVQQQPRIDWDVNSSRRGKDDDMYSLAAGSFRSSKSVDRSH